MNLINGDPIETMPKRLRIIVCKIKHFRLIEGDERSALIVAESSRKRRFAGLTSTGQDHYPHGVEGEPELFALQARDEM